MLLADGSTVWVTPDRSGGGTFECNRNVFHEPLGEGAVEIGTFAYLHGRKTKVDQ